jgi:hypothetical protein
MFAKKKEVYFDLPLWLGAANPERSMHPTKPVDQSVQIGMPVEEYKLSAVDELNSF